MMDFDIDAKTGKVRDGQEGRRKFLFFAWGWLRDGAKTGKVTDISSYFITLISPDHAMGLTCFVFELMHAP